MTGQVTISIKLFGTLRERLLPTADRGVREVSVPAGTTAAEALAHFGLAAEESIHLVVMVNGRQVEVDHELQKDDVLSAFSAVAGG
jgi:sulfur carrier protein ThiS